VAVDLAEVLSADPAPVVLALAAGHVHAAAVLLDRHLAPGTVMRTDLVGPALIHAVLRLRARFALVPVDAAFEAHAPLACLALYLLRPLRGLNDRLALGVRTELLVAAAHRNLVILLE